MKKVKLEITFLGGKSHAYVNIVPSANYSIYRQDFSGSHEFSLKSGEYDFYLEGNCGGEGSSAKIYVDDELKGTKPLKKGYYSKVFTIKF